MKFKYIFLFILIVLAGILFFTNPDENTHKAFLKNKFTELFNQKAEEELNKTEDPHIKLIGNIGKNLFPALGDKWVDNLIDTRTERKNYYLFSTIQILYKDQWYTVGLGIFNKVFLFPSVEEKVQDLDVTSEALKLLNP